ncbi:hypothetical protein F2Q69_00016107 [Brassica cretica]|uniref:RNA helicase n=1 Tax=Brassica cretica TaxID=69181 RepID=A0A8S9QVK0_BRACR|nr:hypothetical protein F2Q69_00016107 [Brassica cretica]
MVFYIGDALTFGLLIFVVRVRHDYLLLVYTHHLPRSQGRIKTSVPVGAQIGRDRKSSLQELAMKSVPRRIWLTSVFMNLCCNPSRYLSALALGDPSVATVEDVSPPVVFPAGPLFPTEGRIVQLFEKNTYSVVNIFDVTLRPQLKMTGVVEIPEGNGSGVVWDEQGYIVTNYHVIGNALSRNPIPGDVVGRVNILTSDGVQKNFEGKLVGADRAKDLAVLKVEAPETLLKPIRVGQSNSLKVGQQCLAIGNPFGFDHTLTVGVISGLNRDIFSQTGVTIGGGIQTDAAINPGNSLSKYNGDKVVPVPASQVKQIAGRAGRRGSRYPDGLTTTLHLEDLTYLIECLQQPFDEVRKVGLFPFFEQIEIFAAKVPDMAFSKLLEHFGKHCRLDGSYFLCRHDHVKKVANMLEKVQGLSLEDRFNFCFAPVNIRNPKAMYHLYRMASTYSQDMPVNVAMGMPKSSARNDTELLDLESRHQVLSMYLWLSNQFEEKNFPFVEKVEAMATNIAELLGESLTKANWKMESKEEVMKGQKKEDGGGYERPTSLIKLVRNKRFLLLPLLRDHSPLCFVTAAMVQVRFYRN